MAVWLVAVWLVAVWLVAVWVVAVCGLAVAQHPSQVGDRAIEARANVHRQQTAACAGARGRGEPPSHQADAFYRTSAS